MIREICLATEMEEEDVMLTNSNTQLEWEVHAREDSPEHAMEEETLICKGCSDNTHPNLLQNHILVMFFKQVHVIMVQSREKTFEAMLISEDVANKYQSMKLLKIT